MRARREGIACAPDQKRGKATGDGTSATQGTTFLARALREADIYKEENYAIQNVCVVPFCFIPSHPCLCRPVVHPLVDPHVTPVCLITKDPQREYKDLLEAKKIKFISRVVGITKLKGKFKPFEAKRLLLKENGMFLAD